ncbi:MAG: hypothetical protein FJ109_05655 [Deltaproteobacteria bacterium]|nr:hypothetical protein [Deltaproteobacteria bacterium]
MRPLSIFALLVSLAATEAAAQPATEPAAEVPTVEGKAALEMDSDAPRAGETITYRLKVTLDAGYELQVPENLRFVDGLEPVRDGVVLKKKEEGSRTAFDLSIPFVVMRLGRLKLPERTFEARGPGGMLLHVKTGRVKVTTGTWFPNENNPLPGSPVGPLPLIERNWLLIWSLVILGIVALAVGVTFAVSSRLRRRRAPVGLPPRPAGEVALEKLDALEKRDLPKVGELNLFYTELSQVLREYLGGRWAFDSMDLTSTELMRRMERVRLEHFLLEKIGFLLSDFDLVKFAKVVPTSSRAAEDLERVRNLVLATRPLPAVDPVVAASPGADATPPEFRPAGGASGGSEGGR